MLRRSSVLRWIRRESKPRRPPSITTGGRWQPIKLPPVPPREAGRLREHHVDGPWGAEAEPNRIEVRFEMARRDGAISFAKELTEAGYQVSIAVVLFCCSSSPRIAIPRTRSASSYVGTHQPALGSVLLRRRTTHVFISAS